MAVRSKRRFVVKRILTVIGVAIFVLMGLGFVYEQLGERRDRQRLPQIGQAIDIGGRTMNLFCSGAGSPAVIFDSGAGASGYSWAQIQPEVARFTIASAPRPAS